RAHRDDRPALPFDVGADDLGELSGFRDIDLVQYDYSRLVLQPAVGGELSLDGVDVGDGVTLGLQGRAVDDVRQHSAPLDVAQELKAKALARRRTGNQPGHVGDDERVGAGANDAEVGYECREWIVGDLRPGGGEH